MVIIEFVLDQLPKAGTAGALLHLSLLLNYMVELDKLCHELIFFNIGGQDQLGRHLEHMAKIVMELKKGYVDFSFRHPSCYFFPGLFSLFTAKSQALVQPQ